MCRVKLACCAPGGTVRYACCAVPRSACPCHARAYGNAPVPTFGLLCFRPPTTHGTPGMPSGLLQVRPVPEKIAPPHVIRLATAIAALATSHRAMTGANSEPTWWGCGVVLGCVLHVDI